MPENKLPELSPCPFCGKSAAHINVFQTGTKTPYYVSCSACDAATANGTTPSEAVSAWNYRVIEGDLRAQIDSALLQVATLKEYIQELGLTIENNNAKTN